MKKKLVILLSAILIMATAVGCSSNNDTAQETTAAAETTAPAATAATTAPAQTVPSENVIGEKKAKQIALERVPGAKESDIIKLHLDLDDGRQEYEGEIIYNNKEYDFEIDAVSGEVYSWDEESLNN